jgi:hypothetical protein
MRKLIIILSVGIAGLVAGSVAPVATAAPALKVALVRLSPDTAVVNAVCPVDPPTTVFISSDQGLIGSTPVECTRQHQRFVVPVSADLTPGEVLTGVQVAVSGDSGEVNAFYDSVTVRR